MFRKFLDLKIGVKLIILFLLVGIVPLAITGFQAYNRSSAALTKAANNQLLAIAAIKKNQIESYFGERMGDVVVLAANPYTIEAAKNMDAANDAIRARTGVAGKDLLRDRSFRAVYDKYLPVFKHYMEEYGYYDLFITGPSNGDVFFTVGQEDDFGTELSREKTGLAEVWEKCLRSGKPEISDIEKYAPSNDIPAMFVAAAIYEKGKAVGVLGLQIALDQINNVMQERTGLGESGETYLIGQDLLMRTDSRFSKEATTLVQKIDTITGNKALNGQSGVETVPDYRGINVVSAYDSFSIGDFKWAILAEIDEAEALAPVKALARQIMIIGIIIAVLIVLVAMGAGRMISNPIIKVVDMLKDVAEGDGDLTKRIDVLGKDETGQLAEYFNKFIGDVESIMGQIRSTAEQIAAASEEISSNAQNVSQGAQNQSSTIEEITASVEQLTSSINDVAKNSQETNSLAQDSASQATDGGKSVDASVGGMKLISNSSTQIADIIGTISDIADQTNLLALNAAIEAARAGEHGMGFAVVADEVRKLAERTQGAAKEITALIRESTKNVDEGSKLSEEAGEALKKIVEGIKNTSDRIGQITASTQEQAATAGEVSKAVENVSKITEENAGSSEEMASSSEELASQADGLKQIVGKFKVSESTGGAQKQAAAAQQFEHKGVVKEEIKKAVVKG